MKQESRPFRRRFRNYLLQPLLQIRLGLYSIVLALLFSLAILSILYVNLYRFYEMVLELTDMRQEVSQVLESYLTDTIWWVVAVVLTYLAVNVVMSVFFTHRLVGPTIAFRRHVQALKQKKYNSRIVLRKRDAFKEVAEDLNQLAQSLEREGSGSSQ